MSNMNVAKSLLERAGAEMEGKFITKPAIMLLELDGSMTIEGRDLVHYFVKARGEKLNISNGRDKVTDFANRLTYMSFLSDKYDVNTFLDKLRNLGHTGFFNRRKLSFFIGGVSTEAILELISNNKHKACRTSTSNTHVQDDTFYANVPEDMRDYIDKFSNIRDELLENYNEDAPIQYVNQFNLGFKAGYAVISMDIVDFIKVSQSRINDNCETEVTNIFTEMRRIIDEEYGIEL